ncbi:MAG TPA: iron transporter [Solirubrobacteraceae bacterium]|nr:iron transporter [Solirubrobacteraceae bacterium]
MFGPYNFHHAAKRLLPVLATGLLIAGCASADKTSSTAATSTAAASSSGSTSSSAMAGMNMGNPGTAGGSVSVDGIKPVPTQILGTAIWQGMKITAQAMTAVPFVIYDGTSEQMVKPTSKTSFHLMVMLNDSQTGVAIPYASVWATITQNGKIDFDERQWPMISRYMGPHYGNDVSLPGAGEYQLSLLVSPPVSARHVEYQNVWLHPHKVNFTFHWSPTS